MPWALQVFFRQLKIPHVLLYSLYWVIICFELISLCECNERVIQHQLKPGALQVFFGQWKFLVYVLNDKRKVFRKLKLLTRNWKNFLSFIVFVSPIFWASILAYLYFVSKNFSLCLVNDSWTQTLQGLNVMLCECNEYVVECQYYSKELSSFVWTIKFHHVWQYSLSWMLNCFEFYWE